MILEMFKQSPIAMSILLLMLIAIPILAMRHPLDKSKDKYPSHVIDEQKVTVTTGRVYLIHVSAWHAKHQFVSTPNQAILVSNDHGETWKSTGLIKNWDSKTGYISTHGNGMGIFTKEGELYTSDNFGKNWKLNKN